MEIERVNVRDKRDVARRFGVIAIPVLVFIRDGVEVGRIKRPGTEREIREFMERHYRC